ncbi:MAG: hypothetical protein HDR75_04465 [Bacteroides sp.]|nr:hypothetical protein [Bacteroides sp.]MBD5372583.1 hypothetical protein [Bacteroides sp.]
MWIIIIISIIILAIILLNKSSNNGTNNTSFHQSAQFQANIMDSVNKIAAANKDPGFYWRGFKSRKPQAAKDIEKITGKDMSKLSDIDAFQIVTMLQRISNNANLPISALKQSAYDQLFSHCSSESEIDEIISRFRSEKYKEASTFNIKPDNTYCNLLIEWAIEHKKNLSNGAVKDAILQQLAKNLDLNNDELESLKKSIERTEKELNLAPDISQLDNEENRLIKIAERAVDRLSSTYKPLSEDGKSEALIFCTTCLIDLPTNYDNSIDLDKKEDRYFLLLHDKVMPKNVEFLNSRIRFYTDEQNKLRTQSHYTPMFIYNAFYMNPMCEHPEKLSEFKESPMELLIFQAVLTDLQLFIKEEKSLI